MGMLQAQNVHYIYQSKYQMFYKKQVYQKKLQKNLQKKTIGF